eukprot:9349331-Lingulodinium_polyedra.AAC.1
MGRCALQFPQTRPCPRPGKLCPRKKPTPRVSSTRARSLPRTFGKKRWAQVGQVRLVLAITGTLS